VTTDAARKDRAMQKQMYRIVVAINESDLAMSARYDLYATSSMDASQQATDAAGREFGKAGLWTTESIEMW
jgi:hypothetical protein